MLQNARIRVAFFRGLIIAASLIFLPNWPLEAGEGTQVLLKSMVRRGEGGSAAIGKGSSAGLGLSPDSWPPLAVGSLDARVLELALTAARCATSSALVSVPKTLTVIDYSKPSTEPRLWVLDLENRTLLYEELVAHGQGSGANFATKFSNLPETHSSSLGLFVTEDTYVGKNGYSLRLNGLDLGFNDLARARAIVMHGAPYVSMSFAQSTGRLGRSWGCPALREPIARELINRVKSGGLVFAYYPDPDWLNSSRFLRGCQA